VPIGFADEVGSVGATAESTALAGDRSLAAGGKLDSTRIATAALGCEAAGDEGRNQTAAAPSESSPTAIAASGRARLRVPAGAGAASAGNAVCGI
jgi:hypothetical protein